MNAEKLYSKKNIVVCVKNDGYPASLEPRKIYRFNPDDEAGSVDFLRVVDESGEDYLYPEGYILFVDLPQPVIEKLSLAV
jgi:hypothetical protein